MGVTIKRYHDNQDDPKYGRYQVVLDNQQVIYVKPQNLAPIEQVPTSKPSENPQAHFTSVRLKSRPSWGNIPDSVAAHRGRFGRHLEALEATGDLTVVQECLVGTFLLFLMFMVYLFMYRITVLNAYESNRIRIVRKKAPTFMCKLP